MGGPLERILVTGANGHLGRRFVARVLRQGLAGGVQAVVRSEHAAAALEPLAGLGRLDVAIADPRRAEDLAPLCQGCSHAVHLVGILREGPETRYADAHEKTSAALARAAVAAGVRRAVYLSILGASLDSRNPCLASKARGEQLLLESELPSVVLRVPMVLGEGEVATRALHARARGSLVPLVGGGASFEQPIDALDVVEAILRALVVPDLEDVVLELAGPESLPRRELIRRAAAVLGSSPRIVPIPRAVARALAGLAELILTQPPLTRAVLDVLEHDDRVDPAPACRRLGLELTPLDVTLKRCLLEDDA